MRGIAKALMAYETSSNKSSGVKASAVFYVAAKLRPHLANLMGIGGFRALLSRALVLANAEVSWLREVHVNPDGTLDGLEKAHVQVDQPEFLKGSVVLLAHLLGLLVAFIGLNLTLRQINEIWPKLSPTIWAVAGEEVQHEKAK